ncbi:uncharacterized protein LOC133036991 [Cannabis sativa]|uniref:uncharacterized protein LOC133036991 n=1 Tax=Cannabis sativa TaxID=3483 RepID=UPI0029C9C181|nr:uncharacterized protein LOC133036991 [Cannabis sativa]
MNTMIRKNYTYNGETSLQTRQLLPTRTEYATKMADYVIEQTQKSMEESSEENQIILNPQVAEIHIGQVFANKETLQQAVSLHSIRYNQPFKVKRSSKLDYKLVCIDDNCNWTFLASKHGKTDMFIIRKIEHTHTCSLDITSGDHPQATSNLVGKVIKNKFVNPKRDYTPTEIVDDMADDYSVSISYQKAWRAREKAIVDARRCPQESYSEIPSILYMMQISNPGTITDLVTDEDNKFKYLYFAVGASIKGWQHCTLIIVTDGTFLTNQHGGTLLIASAQNANRHIFPLAFAVVDSENDSSWEWFLHKIKETYGEREGQCIVSDRHESILKAVKETFPDIMHGVCCYHLMKNIKMKFKKGGDELKIAFNSASKAYNIEDFEKSMQDLDNIDENKRLLGEWNWCRKVDKTIWHEQEIQNNDIKYCRISQCSLESSKRPTHRNSTRMPTFIGAKMVETANLLVYQVHDNNRSHIVNLENKTCSCQRFEYDEMPCSHAMAVLSKRNMSCYKYRSYYYTKEAFMTTYEDSILPLGEATSWNIPDLIRNIVVLPPKHKRAAGRPKKQRYKNGLEAKAQVVCGQCRQRGHNKRSCKNDPVLKPPRKRKRS